VNDEGMNHRRDMKGYGGFMISASHALEITKKYESDLSYECERILETINEYIVAAGVQRKYSTHYNVIRKSKDLVQLVIKELENSGYKVKYHNKIFSQYLDISWKE